MRIRTLQKQTKETVNLPENVIFNRFDLIYNNYLLFYIDDKNICIPGAIFGSVMYLGLYNVKLDKQDTDELFQYIYKEHPTVDYIDVKNAHVCHRDLMPELLYYIDIDMMQSKKADWIDRAKQAAQKFQKEQGKYSILNTKKPARDDKTTHENIAPDDPEYKLRLKNMDIIQFRVNDKTEAMLLVNQTDDTIVFEHITSNEKFTKDYDIELVLCMEAILFYANANIKKIYLSGTTTELKRRLNAICEKTHSGRIWREDLIYKLVESMVFSGSENMKKIAIPFLKIFMDKERRKNFDELIRIRTSDSYNLAKRDVWFDFYETKSDANFTSFEYFNHETSKNYIDVTMKYMPLRKTKNFMDIGCGTGYMIYRMHKHFKKIYGIELEKKWIEIANDNFAKLGIKNYEILNSDINKVPSGFFDNADIFYMFNPFIGETMKTVVRKLEQSFKRKKRTGYVVYINALNRSFFDESKSFKKHKEFKLNNRTHVIYKTV